ncbi:MAG: MarR family transcriptional regulator [Anaerolineaceae bacterium]
MQQAEEDQLSTFFANRGVDIDAHRAVFETIRAASVMVAVMEERALRPLGLTHAGYRLLCELWIKGPLELRDLAAFMIVSRPSIVGTVDTLEGNGLVERTRSTLDRRLVSIVLTPAGLQLVERADVAWHDCQVEVTSALSTTEKRRLAALGRSVTQRALLLRDSTPPS